MEPGHKTYKVKPTDCLKLRARLKNFVSAGYASTFTLYGGTPDPYTRSTGGATLTMTQDGNDTLIVGEVPSAIVGTLGLDARYEWKITEPGGCDQIFVEGKVLLI